MLVFYLLIAVLLGLPSVLIGIDFVAFFVKGKSLYSPQLNRIMEVIVIIVLPFLYLTFTNKKNTCCSDSAPFSPQHVLTIYILTILCVIAYFLSTSKRKILSPITEVMINLFLLVGIVLNIFTAFHIEQPLWLFGNLPISLLFTLRLIENHKSFLRYNEDHASETKNALELLAWKILVLEPILKFPLLFILCLPLLTIIACLLLLFGQKPTSAIKAFTDTYKHGFSQLDYLCDNVTCGGHFLCSVAANGHTTIVKPLRFGERAGGKIICNRQLLIANAFEEVIEQVLPRTHQFIRRNYNQVGHLIHRYYYIFESKIVSDLIYILMKPLEMIFLVTLYTFDQKPENRIAQQYLKKADRQHLVKQNGS